jgi:LytS/YehU family sensor histidine kinase
LEKKEGEKVIRIFLEREGNYVSLLVEDNGPENIDNPSFESGIGLQNLKKRFDLTYNIKSKIFIERVNSVTKVKLTWPYTRGVN